MSISFLVGAIIGALLYAFAYRIGYKDGKATNKCNNCANWDTKDCPNSAECYSLKNKPYYKSKRQ